MDPPPRLELNVVHRIDQIIADLRREEHRSRRRGLVAYACCFVAVMGLAILYTQVRDLTRENQRRVAENAALVHQIQLGRHERLLEIKAAFGRACQRDQLTYRYLRDSIAQGTAVDRKLLRTPGHGGFDPALLREAIRLNDRSIRRFAPIPCDGGQVGTR